MTHEEVKQLLIKYNSGQCTAEEKALVETSFLQFNEEDYEINFERIEAFKQETRKKLPKPNRQILLNPVLITAAAAAIILITIGLYLSWPGKSFQSQMQLAETIGPKGNKAIITFSDGSLVSLSSNKKAIKICSDQLVYDDGTIAKIAAPKGMQTISTPKGGEYKIVLSDGTKVWLNAATVLQFPDRFAAQGSRVVKLVSGEAYFEVHKDKKHPFMVSTTNQSLTVLGTKFNINAYDQLTKTTLLEGSVKIAIPRQPNNKANEVLLSPGEQTVVTSAEIIKSPIDTSLAVAWKNGKIKFRDASLEEILTGAERWYDLEVKYEGKIPGIHLTGGISRSSNLSTLLRLLQLSGVKFKLKVSNQTRILSIEEQ